MTVQQAYELALEHHQAGRLAEAEALYRQILAVQPNHAEALHLLGVIACQGGHSDAATQLIRQAISLNPNDPNAHYNLGNAFCNQMRLDEAIAAYRRALALRPDFVEAHHNLGLTLGRLGHVAEAIAAYVRVLELKPDFAEAHNDLGIALAARGQLEEAITALRRAIELKPHFADAHNNLANVLKERGQLEEAIAAYRRAIDLNPNLSATHYNLGIAFGERGQLDRAVAAYRRALELQPGHVEAHNNLGNALKKRGQFGEAIAAYRRALELQPTYMEAYNNLGNALTSQGQIEEATIALRQALKLRPDSAATHNNLGNALRLQGQLEEAIGACRRALELQPDFAEAHSNLGNALRDQGRLEEAIAAYRVALKVNPAFVQVHSNLAYTLHFLPSDKAIIAERAKWNQQFGEPFKRSIPQHTNARDPDRRLRVGYVSPDFRKHVVGRNLLPLFKHHDDRDYEIACYSGTIQVDALTDEFRRRAAVWRSTVGIEDDTLAEIIRQDGVDILVDLTQHMSGNRLAMFARHPAPVQVSFAGYPESTGVEAIKYRISDRHLEPKTGYEAPGTSGRQEETTLPTEQVFLIDSFWCYDQCEINVEINELPAKSSGRVTFGCLNNFCKINEPLLRLWTRVLGRIPTARLVILSGFGSHRQWTLDFLEREGVTALRVEFVEPRPRKAYLELYHRLDMVLDTFLYNGHTTSLDALWMGVPVVSLTGERPVSRAGLSQLSNLGLPELVAHSEDEYVDIATQLAHDLPRLAELRRTLRERMETSVLMDAPRFARQIEQAYRTMWRRWCAENADA